MKVTRIANPARGEQVVGVHPAMKPLVESVWNRRLDYFTGRSLSDAALATEQNWRSGRLVTLAQTVSPGVVSGLEVTLETESVIDPRTNQPRRNYFLQITPGMGLTASGEDVVLLSPLRLPVANVPAYAPASLLAPREGSGTSTGTPAVPRLDLPRPVDTARPIPRPGFDTIPRPAEAAASVESRLIFRPSVLSRVEPRPVQLQPRRLGPPLGELITANVDIPRVGILVLQPISIELIGRLDPTDPCEQDPRDFAFEDWQVADGLRFIYYAWPTEWQPLPAFGDRWRNRIAAAIFAAETEGASYPALPWEELGVPIGLIAFDAAWQAQFIDRYSVVRAGGKPKRRSAIVSGVGNPFLWQARMQQFAEQLTDADFVNNPIDTVARQFRHLPPAGLLPRDAIELPTRGQAPDVRVGRSRFFPPSYRVEVQPVPLEQLDIAIEASASLQPFDTDLPDRVHILVPVPEAWYEPSLLVVEKVDPEFQQAIDEFSAKETDWLQRREDVRAKAKAVARAVNGKEPVYAENVARTGHVIDPSENAFGTEVKSGKLVVSAIEKLKVDLKADFPALKDDLKFDNAVFENLEGLIADLEAKVDKADDRVDFGFVKVQSDIYRLRQLMLGTVKATRLATSPALAAIAKGESAIATKEDIENYLKVAKGKQVTPSAPPPASRPPSTPPPAPQRPRPTREPGGRVTATSRTSRFLVSEAEIESATTASRVSVAAVERPAAAAPTREVLTTATTGRIQGVFTRRDLSKTDIVQKSPIVGLPADFRTVTIAQRLEDSPAMEAKNFAVATRYDVLKALMQTGIELDDLIVSGVQLAVPQFDQKTKQPVRENVSFATIKSALESRILGEAHAGDADEASFFSQASDVLDYTISFLRTVEGRLQGYKAATETCRDALDDLRASLTSSNKRLEELEEELAETRHDLSVARALLSEEIERVSGINKKRDQIVDNHVRFLAYHRPRTNDLNVDTPVRSLDPGLTEEPVPACLERHDDAPDELRAIISLLREAPVKWFPHVPALLDKLDRIEALHEVVLNAKERSVVLKPEARAIKQVRAGASRFGSAIEKAVLAQHAIVAQHRIKSAAISVSIFAQESWKLVRDQAKEVVSLGDLVDSRHGRSDVARQAARELDQITRVAACLYAKFGEVLPAIRLDWAEQLSQYDETINLRNLAVLPRWADVESLDRREMQKFVDWLYQRVNPREEEAVSLISDLVRICVLLASHAPVNEIVAGHVHKPATVKKGGLVELAADPSRVRIGMHVLMYSKDESVVARGIVEDLSAGTASARVVHTVASSIHLEQNTRVQFGDAKLFGLIR